MENFKNEERNQAIRRGVDFIYRIARNRKNFRAYGPYFTCFFTLIASTSRDMTLRRSVREMGRDIALRWQSRRPVLLSDADPEAIYGLVIAGCGPDGYGPRDGAIKEQIRHAAKRFSTQELFGFDPTTEPPPTNLPETCKCGLRNERGRKSCRNCKKRLTMSNRYYVWSEALCATYWFERQGARLGARYADVLKWLPDLRPYPGPERADYTDFFYTAYAVTHIVYTLNGYGRYNLSPRWLPQEFAFLKASVKDAIESENPDMLGEFLDSLKSFGLSDAHPIMRLGTDYLLSQQNPDGSWGDLNEEDIFYRFHATWAAIDGLREYAWRGERLTYPKLMPLLKQWAKQR